MTKRLLKDGYFNAFGLKEFLHEAQLSRLSDIHSLDDLYNLIGKDFYVIVPCKSLRDPSIVFEGTRLTLVRQHPDGFEFTIRTPSTPERFRLLELEMDHCFNNVLLALTEDSSDTVLRRAMELFYYWVIFSPLSRVSIDFMCLINIFYSNYIFID